MNRASVLLWMARIPAMEDNVDVINVTYVIHQITLVVIICKERLRCCE